MGVADKLCNELFRWIVQQEECAGHLKALAIELENMREKMTTGQLVGNTATVLGSAVLVGTGIATFLTGGLAAPLLAVAAGITAGAGTATSVTFSLVEKWKSSEAMKKAEQTADQIKQTQNKIEGLQKELREECENQCFKASSSDDVQREIIARILKAMAKRRGRDLSLSYIRHLLRSDGMDTHHRYPNFNLDAEFVVKVSCLLAVLGLSAGYLCVKTAATKGQKYFIPLVVTATEEMAGLSLKTVAKGTGQAAGGIFGLIFTIPDLVNNCEELINSKHQSEASASLKTKANEIREAVEKLKNQLKELQEMLEQIPEMECHIDLALEMFGSQIYTQGTICMEYKQTQKQDRKTQKFILLCTKDIGVTKYGSTGKDKSGDNKNKRQKKKATSTEESRRTLNLNQQKEPDQEKSPNKSKTKVMVLKLGLPKIMLSNVRSISNKEEELKKMLEDVENCNMICVTETWMNSDSSRTDIPGYKTLWADRDPRLTQKRRGGGLMMLVNEDWATDVQVENIVQTPDYELMVVFIRPHNHPEGAPPLTFILVYIPPGANKIQAARDIADFYRALEKYGGPVFLLGDFNHCNFDHLGLEQYVTCKTRKENTLDKCYGNVKGAYRSECRPPVGRSDHNVILLIPKDKSDENDSSEDEKCTHEKTKPREQ